MEHLAVRSPHGCPERFGVGGEQKAGLPRRVVDATKLPRR